MVDMLVNIIAENTDEESEPSMPFIEYFNRKKGLRGKSFQQTKKIVEDYAK